MKLLAAFVDPYYPNDGISEVRSIARAIVFDGRGLIAIHHVIRDDAFGHGDYYETPGGGVDAGETVEQACRRECQEELGYDIEIISEIGEIDDFYNLIKRQNLNHYFLARRASFVGKRFVSHGDSLIAETLWVSIDEALRLYEGVEKARVGGLVCQREIPILRLVKTQMDPSSINSLASGVKR